MARIGVPYRLLIATVLVVAVVFAWRAAIAAPASDWSVVSPGGTLRAQVDMVRGSYELSVVRGGRRVLATTLGRAPAPGVAKADESTVRDAFSTPAGKRLRHTLDARRLRLTLDRGRAIDLLVADDGVAFRETGADREPTAWRAPAGARAWLQNYRADYEGDYLPVALQDAKPGDYGFPALLRTGDTWALLSESGLTREAASRMTVGRDRPGELQVTLPPGTTPPHTTPWRVAVVGDLAKIVDSDLPLALGRPSQIRDTSWIHPGRVAWSWWSDPDSPGNEARQQAFVREAADHHWQYVLLDAGWDAGNVPSIVRYANRYGVRVMLWTDWKALRDPAERERLLSQWASWGVAGVKVDFLLSDSAGRMAVMDDIARDTARHRLTLVFHGCTVPRGIQRTWPNVLTLEAVQGAERETPGQGTQAMDAAQDVNLVFTRNTLGSMDYTPVTFSARNRGSTDAHRLALAVVYESGLQHFADTPESYADHPEAKQILTDVPAAWDDTRLLAGAPDREAIIARRSGDNWWIGSISATDSHVQTVGLEFLAPGRTYRLHLVRDDGRGGLAVEDRTVTSRDRLSVTVDRNGGYAAELTPVG
jgi:hypothetical protein